MIKLVIKKISAQHSTAQHSTAQHLNYILFQNNTLDFSRAFSFKKYFNHLYNYNDNYNWAYNSQKREVLAI